MTAVPKIKQTKPLVEQFKLHPVGTFSGTIVEWGQIKQSRNRFNFYAGVKVHTGEGHGHVWVTLNAMPNVLVLLRTFMPVGSEHEVVVKHTMYGEQMLASAHFRAETPEKIDG
jgi:hypothetical protein